MGGGGRGGGGAKTRVGASEELREIINVRSAKAGTRRLTKRSGALENKKVYSARMRGHITPDIIIIKQEITSYDKCAASDAAS